VNIEKFIENDYYKTTKFIGYIAKWITNRLGLKEPEEFLLIRIFVWIIIFYFLGFVIPTIVGLITGDFLINSIEVALLFVWLIIGGILIDFIVYFVNDFWEKFQKISKLNKKEFKNLKIHNNNVFFSRRYSCIISIGLWVFACWAASNEFGYHTRPVVFMILILLIFPAIMWGIGAWITIYTYYFMIKICKTDIHVDPFAPDGIGGLSVLGKLPIRIAFLVTSLTLYVPYSITREFYIGKGTEFWFVNILWQWGIFITIGVMILTFFIPLIPIYKLAKKIKSDLLKTVGFQLKKIVKNIRSEENSNNNYNNLILFEYYKLIQKMKLWPFDLEIIIKLFGFILIPILIAVITISLKFSP